MSAGLFGIAGGEQNVTDTLKDTRIGFFCKIEDDRIAIDNGISAIRVVIGHRNVASDLGFLRIQKSYLVNMHYVEIFQYNKVQLRGGLCLAPSEKNYNELKQKYLHWRGKSRWML